MSLPSLHKRAGHSVELPECGRRGLLSMHHPDRAGEDSLLRSGLGLALMAALYFAAPAAASIVPGRGIAGVTPRMTESQVRGRMGAPLLITQTRGALGFVATRLHYRRIDVDLRRLSGKPVVIRVSTTRPELAQARRPEFERPTRRPIGPAEVGGHSRTLATSTLIVV